MEQILGISNDELDEVHDGGMAQNKEEEEIHHCNRCQEDIQKKDKHPNIKFAINYLMSKYFGINMFREETNVKKETGCPAVERSNYVQPVQGSGENIESWLLDSGAWAHMNPYSKDLNNITKCNVVVLLADGSEIRCTRKGE